MSIQIENLLSRLEKARRTGESRWTACCPAHDDKGPSLAVRETDDGRVLLHCFAGCSVHEVLSAIGLEMGDLFPGQDRGNAPHGKPERRPFPAADVLRCIGFEALVTAQCGRTLLDRKPFSEADQERLILAVSRIQSALTAAGVNHG